MRLAELLGGETITIPGADVATGVVEYAQANNFTHIIVSATKRAHWMELLRGSLAQRIISRAGDIHVHVLADGSQAGLHGGRTRRPPGNRKAAAA